MDRPDKYSSTLLLLKNKSGVGDGVPIPLSPLDAPDSDYLQWFDFSDNSRMTKVSTNIKTVQFAKIPNSPNHTNYSEILDNRSPQDTGLINSLQAGNFGSTGAITRVTEAASIPAGFDFAYTSMTWFLLLRPIAGGGATQDIVSDYGTGTELLIIRLGDGASAFPIQGFMRDASANAIIASSGAQVLSANTNYLIVVKFDGANKTVTIWIDGATTYTNTNASYINTTTFEGGAGDARIGELSQFSQLNPFKGYIGAVFITKTILSNGSINRYAQWMADKWGTTWTAI